MLIRSRHHNRLFRSPPLLIQHLPRLLPVLFPHAPEVLLHALFHLIRQHDDILDVQAAVHLASVVLQLLVPHGHTLVGDDVDLTRLHDLSALARQLHDMPIKVCNVARPVAHPRLPQRQDLPPEQILPAPTEERAVRALVVLLSVRGVRFDEMHDEVARDPVGAFVGLVFVREADAVRHALLDCEFVLFRLAHHAGAVAHGARMRDCLALAPALVALDLHLLEETGRELLSLDASAASAARVACLDVAVFAACTLARGADGLLLDLEFRDATVVEVAEGHRDAEFHVGALTLPAAVPEVAAATKKPTEEVERVVVLARRATLLVLLYALVAILIVNTTGFLVDEDFVGFGHGDKLLVSAIIATGKG